MFLSEIIQDALDDLASAHTSTARKGRALNNLEKLMVDICVPSDGETLKFFVTLQDTFQCNVPSRLLAWVSVTTCRLDALTEKGSLDSEKEVEVATLSSQLIQALSIMQGVVLNHWGSKQYLGRRYALEVLLDLFLTSRHVSPTTQLNKSLTRPPADKSTRREDKGSKESSVPCLASAVLDTLLCILVDSSPALRAFEDTNGVQYVVRILKRAGTPREVRMKCLEFLYFYLMDESATPVDSIPEANFSPSFQLSTAPNSPIKPTFRSATGGSSVSSSSASSSASSGSSSAASTSTYATSLSSTSFSSACFNGSSTPVEQSPPKPSPVISNLKNSPRVVTPPQPRSLLMLRKEVDFVPLSPKKASAAKLGLGSPRIPSRQREARSSEEMEREGSSQLSRSIDQTPRRTQQKLGLTQSAPHLNDSKPETAAFKRGHRRAQSSLDIRLPAMPAPPDPRTVGRRTMEEKKEILGSMLGNVDALVEGVRKAGIWGLG